MRLGQNLVQMHAEALARQLNRSVEDVRSRGLNALDFKDTLKFDFDDGSHAVFRYSFFLHAPAQWAVIVFTEHCGYFAFPDAVRISDEAGQVLFDGLR